MLINVFKKNGQNKITNMHDACIYQYEIPLHRFLLNLVWLLSFQVHPLFCRKHAQIIQLLKNSAFFSCPSFHLHPPLWVFISSVLNAPLRVTDTMYPSPSSRCLPTRSQIQMHENIMDWITSRVIIICTFPLMLTKLHLLNTWRVF